jgi:hypothetical protein
VIHKYRYGLRGRSRLFCDDNIEVLLNKFFYYGAKNCKKYVASLMYDACFFYLAISVNNTINLLPRIFVILGSDVFLRYRDLGFFQI